MDRGFNTLSPRLEVRFDAAALGGAGVDGIRELWVSSASGWTRIGARILLG